MALKEYYERFLEVLENDIDILLREQDPLKRAPKIILDYLKMAQTCEESLTSLTGDVDKEWERLSQEAQKEILDIIKRDLGVETT